MYVSLRLVKHGAFCIRIKNVWVYNDAGLAGATDLDQARADMVMDCYEDAVKPMFNFMFEPDAAKKVTTDEQTLVV